eukprot:gene16940-biopygen15863
MAAGTWQPGVFYRMEKLAGGRAEREEERRRARVPGAFSAISPRHASVGRVVIRLQLRRVFLERHDAGTGCPHPSTGSGDLRANTPECGVTPPPRYKGGSES